MRKKTYKRKKTVNYDLKETKKKQMRKKFCRLIIFHTELGKKIDQLKRRKKKEVFFLPFCNQIKTELIQ